LWTDEYGDPDVPEEFDWVWGYSPYHKVVDAQRYPAVLFTTAEGDTRVDPLHARKMAARMIDAAPVDGAPVLLHQEGRAGHGVGKPASKRAAEGADVLTFMAWQLAPANAV
jgi:prolyl oligopeptidase